MRLLTALLIPTLAAAQPAPDPAQPPRPPDPGAPPPVSASPQPNYLAAQAYRSGITFEADLGVGFIWASAEERNSKAELALGGLSLGVGGWVNPRLAITGRIAGVTYAEDCGIDDTCTLTSVFVGPSAQYWIDDQTWIGGGLGFAVVYTRSSGTSDSDAERGLGLDLRAGYTFSRGTASTWNIAAEYTPGFYTIDRGLGASMDRTIHGFGLLLGYQHL